MLGRCSKTGTKKGEKRRAEGERSEAGEGEGGCDATGSWVVAGVLVLVEKYW